MIKLFTHNKLSAFLVIVIFMMSIILYQAYWMLACTTYSYLSDEVTIKCTIEGEEKSVHLTGLEANTFCMSWAGSGFSPNYSALCHEPAFEITFHNVFINTTIRDVCFQCSNFPGLFGLIGFKSSGYPAIYVIMEEHFPGLGFEKYLRKV